MNSHASLCSNYYQFWFGLLSQNLVFCTLTSFWGLDASMWPVTWVYLRWQRVLLVHFPGNHRTDLGPWNALEVLYVLESLPVRRSPALLLILIPSSWCSSRHLPDYLERQWCWIVREQAGILPWLGWCGCDSSRWDLDQWTACHCSASAGPCQERAASWSWGPVSWKDGLRDWLARYWSLPHRSPRISGGQGRCIHSNNAADSVRLEFQQLQLEQGTEYAAKLIRWPRYSSPQGCASLASAVLSA